MGYDQVEIMIYLAFKCPEMLWAAVASREGDSLEQSHSITLAYYTNVNIFSLCNDVEKVKKYCLL